MAGPISPLREPSPLMSCGYKSLHTDRGGDIFCVGHVCIGISIGFGVNIDTVLFAPHLTNLSILHGFYIWLR